MATGGVLTWEELNHLVESNGIAQLRRSVECLSEYRAYKEELSASGESLFSHLIFDSLGWAKREDFKDIDDIEKLPQLVDIKPRDPRLLADADDIKILLNDFPYHFEPNVRHLVVWTKVNIKADPQSELGDITPETRQIIDRYVQKTFQEFLQSPPEKIVWFRNWTALQSVRSISHIHVVVKDMTEAQFDKVFKKSGIPVDFDAADKDLSPAEYLS